MSHRNARLTVHGTRFLGPEGGERPHVADGGQSPVLDRAGDHHVAAAGSAGHWWGTGVGFDGLGIGEPGAVVVEFGQDPGAGQDGQADPQTVGGRADLRLADAPPTARPRELWTSSPAAVLDVSPPISFTSSQCGSGWVSLGAVLEGLGETRSCSTWPGVSVSERERVVALVSYLSGGTCEVESRD